MSNTYMDIVGAPPLPTKLEWFEWYYRLLNHRISEVEEGVANNTVYYFAANGDDSTGNGSEAQPWRTVAKANAEIAASSGSITCLFRRNDEFVSTTTLAINNKDRVKIGAYGTGLPPLIHCFAQSIASGAAAWTVASGDRYTTSVANAVGWIRQTGSNENRLTAFRHMNSTAGVEATPRSWFWSGGTLHINAGTGIDPNTLSFEYSLQTQANIAGITVTNSDQVLIENIRADGYGAVTSGSAEYPFKVLGTAATDRILVRDCEAHTGGSHLFGSVGALGPITWLRCVAGQGIFASGNFTSYVTFATDLTGVEAIYESCRCIGGEMPDTAYAGPYHSAHQGFFAHDGSGNTTFPALMILSNCKEDAAIWRTNFTVTSGSVMLPGIGDESDITTLRTFVVNHNVYRPTLRADMGFAKRVVYINPRYEFMMPDDNALQIGTAVPSGGHIINLIAKIKDLDDGQQKWFLGTNGANSNRFYFCSIYYDGHTSAAPSDFNGIHLNWSGGTPTSFFDSCMIVRAGTKTLRNGLGNNSTFFRNLAGFGLFENADAVRGFDLTPGYVRLEFPIDPFAVSFGNGMVGAGSQIGLEYDHFMNIRPTDEGTFPTIGAVEGDPQPYVTEAEGGTGNLNIPDILKRKLRYAFGESNTADAFIVYMTDPNSLTAEQYALLEPMFTSSLR